MRTAITTFVCVASAMLLGGQSAKALAPAEVIDSFVKSCQERFEGEELQSALATVDKLRENELTQPYAVSEALAKLYPAYQAASESLASEDAVGAIGLLKELVTSEDDFLAADASLALARAYIYEERYSAALPLLTAVVDKYSDKTLLLGDAMFLRGVSQSKLLDRQSAIASLEKFLEDHPNTSERMRVAAMRQIEQLKALQEETIEDAFERMDFVRRNLQGGQSGQPTQKEQEKVIDILAKLIKEAEERECNCAGGGQSKSEGQGNKSQGGKNGGGKGESLGGNGEGDNDQTPGAEVVRTFKNGPASGWDRLREHKRDPAYSAVKARFSPRYEKLIEQYYKSFQDDE